MTFSRSSTERFLQGKFVPGLPKPVQSVMKEGDTRIITDTAGNVLKISEGRLMSSFNKVLAEHQRVAALKTVRKTKGYTATAILGGKEKGEKQTFPSVAAAKAAINKRYNQSPYAGKSR